MSSEEKPVVNLKLSLPLWKLLDVLHELDGDEYLEFRDAIIKALDEEAEAMWELTCK